MIKKMLLLYVLSFGFVQAQYNNIDQEYAVIHQEIQEDQECIEIAYQELVYEIGMSLAEQDVIIDIQTAKNALLQIYQEIDEVGQIVDIFIESDEELIEYNITSLDAFFDYALDSNELVAQRFITWIITYQNLFKVFQSLHSAENSFATWCQDMLYIESIEDSEELTTIGYLELWQASIMLLEAQADFEDVLAGLE